MCKVPHCLRESPDLLNRGKSIANNVQSPELSLLREPTSKMTDLYLQAEMRHRVYRLQQFNKVIHAILQDLECLIHIVNVHHPSLIIIIIIIIIIIAL
jgi:hypothetical protein